MYSGNAVQGEASVEIDQMTTDMLSQCGTFLCDNIILTLLYRFSILLSNTRTFTGVHAHNHRLVFPSPSLSSNTQTRAHCLNLFPSYSFSVF